MQTSSSAHPLSDEENHVVHDVDNVVASDHESDEENLIKKKVKRKSIKRLEFKDINDPRKGLRAIYNKDSLFWKFKARGAGHECSDIDRLLLLYQSWAHNLTPHYSFNEVLAQLEKSVKKSEVTELLRGLREREYERHFSNRRVRPEGDNPSDSSDSESEPAKQKKKDDEAMDVQERIKQNKARALEIRRKRAAELAHKQLENKDEDGFDEDELLALESVEKELNTSGKKVPEDSNQTSAQDDDDGEVEFGEDETMGEKPASKPKVLHDDSEDELEFDVSSPIKKRKVEGDGDVKMDETVPLANTKDVIKEVPQEEDVKMDENVAAEGATEMDVEA